MHPTHGERIGEALFDIITAASVRDVEVLKQAIEFFKTDAHRSYNRVRQHPFARALLDACDEAVEFASMEAGK